MGKLNLICLICMMSISLIGCTDKDPASEEARYDLLFGLEGKELTGKDVVFAFNNNEVKKDVPLSVGQSITISDVTKQSAVVLLKGGEIPASQIPGGSSVTSIPVPNVFGTMEDVTVPVKVSLHGVVLQLEGATETSRGSITFQ